MVTDSQDDRPRAEPDRAAFSLGRPLARRGRGTDRHPDVELLDALAGGEPVARSAREHIDACPACRESVAALRRVRAELSQLAGLTMPGDVAERIQATLAHRLHTSVPPVPEPSAPTDARSWPPASHPASEHHAAQVPMPAPPLDTPDPASGTSGPAPARPLDPAEPSTPHRAPHTARPVRTRTGPKYAPHRPAGRRGPGRRAGLLCDPASGRRDWISIAAVCVAFVTFSAALFALRDLRGGTTSTLPEARAAQEPGADAAAPPMTMVANSHVAVLPTTIVPHGEALLDGGITGSMALAMGLTRVPTIGSAAQAARAGVADPPLGVLRSGPGSGAPGVNATGVRVLATTAAGRLRALLDTPDLRTCYQSLLAQTGGSILGIDLVRYNGQAALLIVLSVPSQPSLGRLLVVDASCGMTRSSTAPLYSVIAKRE
ncbi:anti-sigma factor family protein [Candidatus Frankia nodulisporulans]|uniref:anti-sigma factor family protein n=1 Tax=Candidatus Frankia nodulisporulans TaxID=2060052 RepID=UPI001FD2FFC0|nr:hypothetical protein [Candidatus Frankia nodulisporulans]